MSTVETAGITHIEGAEPQVFLHAAFFLPGGSTIGGETFRVVKLSGQEHVSQPFDFQLELRANTVPSGARALRFEQLIGRPVTFGIDRPDFRLPKDSPPGMRQDASGERFAAALKGRAADPTLSLFNGIVTSFSMSAPGVYKASVKPALWKLTLTNRYRMLVDKSIAQAIEALMREHGIECSLNDIAGMHNLAQTRKQDWMQAGESDYALLQRLMGKAQIHYYFAYSGRGHTVVFSNRASYPPIAFDRALDYTYTDMSALGVTQGDVVSQYTYEEALVTTGVECVLARQHESWEVDAIPTFETFAAGPSDPGALPFIQYRQFQYGVSDWQARETTQLSEASRRAQAASFSGASTCAQLRVGHRFRLRMPVSGAAGQTVQPSLDQQSFVLTQVSHEASIDGEYHNTFSATDPTSLITPFSIDQTQQGSLLATVVNADGSTTPNDWRYYMKQNFEMAMSDQSDRDASPSTQHSKGVYVSFATDRATNAAPQPVWIKLAAHMQTVPEVGVTVVVARAQDESELPEIQSIVHANGSRVATPSGWTANTSVGNNFSTSYSDSKSMRFGAASNVTGSTFNAAIGIVTAAYDSGQYRDASYSQGASYSHSTSEDREKGLLHRSISYGSTYGQSWAQEQQNFSAVGRSYNQSIVGSASPDAAQPRPSPMPLAVSTNVNQVRGDAYSESENIGNIVSKSRVAGDSSSEHTVTGMNASSSTIAQNRSTSLTGLSTASNTTGMSLSTNMVGMTSDTSVTGIARHMSTIGDQANLTVIGSTNNTNVTGASTSMSMTGVQSSMNMVGQSSSIDMQGSVSSIGLVGNSTRVNVTGDGTEVSVAGSHTQVSMQGVSNTVTMCGGGVEIRQGAAQPKIDLSNATIQIVGVIQIYL